MHVVATAGHVDHGKSTLVRALTGMEPDRWSEERRRGLTIDLGFAWTALPDGAVVAFVDVPGHDRFVTNMLAGVGPVPAVLLVVAADEGWRQQSTEHLSAIDALGVSHGLLVITRTDLADPAKAASEATQRLAHTALRDVETVAVSASNGAGLEDLRAALGRLVRRLAPPDLTDRLRLWVDRSFAISGAGTVVTGTLTAGTIAVDDTLALATSGRRVRVRRLQCLGAGVDRAEAVARVAVNLRGIDHNDVRRGDALVLPDAWITTDAVDVRASPGALGRLPGRVHLVLHIGTAAVPARVRLLGDDVARLRLMHRLPLRIGDRALLREPSNHRLMLAVTVVDPAPPVLNRRGDAAKRAAALRQHDGVGAAAAELDRRGIVTRQELARLGVLGDLPAAVVGDWVVSDQLRATVSRRMATLVDDHQHTHPLEPGMTLGALAAALGLPDTGLVAPLVPAGLTVAAGRVQRVTRDPLPPAVEQGLSRLRETLGARPFAAPGADELRSLGLARRELAAAARAGAVLVLTEAVVLLPDAPERATALLQGLGPTFTVSQARQTWSTSRRVAVPLLELLDRTGVTEQLADGSRRLVRVP